MTLRYLLDEHIPNAVARALRRYEPPVVIWRIGQPGAPPIETTDPDVLIWCEAHDFVLVTNNRATMSVHLQTHLAAGRHVPGIFIINLPVSHDAMAEELWLAAHLSLEDEYRDQLRYLPL
jgi:hypothetical protein